MIAKMLCVGLVGFATPALADLRLSRVMLSTGGVGYLEYAGAVDAAGTLGLDVRLDQVDDVLKSLVVFDAAGQVRGLELPGRDATDAGLDGLPFGADALADPLAYLNGLAGVVLTVGGPRPMTGRLMHAEKITVGSADQPEEKTRVTLLAEDGLRQFILEDAETVQVADPALRSRIARALAAVRHDPANTLRHITLHLSGPARQVRLGAVVGAPLWKTSYRLVLPEAGAARARLQGWAVLENTTGNDWAGVSLALQYGNPVTFRQALYESYLVERPIVPVEILGRVLPDPDSRAVAEADATPEPAQPRAKMAPQAMAARPMAPPAPAAMPSPATPPPPLAQSEAAAASEGAEETVFVLPNPVSLAAGHTASVPILDREVSASRIGLLQAQKPHPLSSVRIVNDSGTSLPGGVLTLYDPSSPAAFAGDARLAGLPAGESRLLSFAEDLRTQAVWRQNQTSTITAVTAAQGVLRVEERLRYATEVTLTAPTLEGRALLVEIPKQPNTPLAADAPRPLEETATAWRFAVALAPAETRRLAVAAERVTRQETRLLQDDRVVALLLGRADLGPVPRAALQRLADLRTRKATADATVGRLKTQLDRAAADEDRTRKNLAAVPAADALHARLVRQLEAQDGRITDLQGQVDKATTAADQAQADLAQAVGGFAL